MDIFNLIGKLTLDTSDYDAKINEAKNKGEDLAKNTKNKVSPMAVAGWTAIAVAIVGVIKKMGDLALATANYADQVGDTAEKWGFTTKEIQEFDYWATQNGTTLQSLLTGMRGLVNQAEAGSSAFAKLGVAVRNNDGTFKDQRTLFLETMNALQGVDDQIQRNALQFEIFGRAGIELGQVINKSGDELEKLSQRAEDYGLIISEEAIQKSSDFNDELDILKRQFQSLVAEMLADTPEAQRKFEEFTNNLEEMIRKYLPTFIRFLSKMAGVVVVEIIRQLPVLIESIFDAILDLDWYKLGMEISWEIIKGLAKTLWEGVQMIFGKGWLWGTDNGIEVNNTSTESALNALTTTSVNERTTKTEESLEVTMKVESDGTVASEQNLDVISELIVERINKAMGDMING